MLKEILMFKVWNRGYSFSWCIRQPANYTHKWLWSITIIINSGLQISCLVIHNAYDKDLL